MLVYKYLYIILFSLSLTNCSKSSSPFPAPNNDWQKMGLKGRVKYCFYQVFRNDGSRYNSVLYDTVYHFSQDGLLAYSKMVSTIFHNCTSQIPIVFEKYEYYSDKRLKNKYVYLEYYNSKNPNTKEYSGIYDIEFYTYTNNTTKIQHLISKYSENFNQYGLRTEKYDYSNLQKIHLSYFSYDSLKSLNKKEEYYISPQCIDYVFSEYKSNILQQESRYLYCDTCNYQTPYFKTIILEDSIFSNKIKQLNYLHIDINSNIRYQTFIPVEIHRKQEVLNQYSYKYDKHGNWIEKISKYGDHVKRKIEYW